MTQETKFNRKDLKEPDQFLVTTNKFLNFLNRHKGPLIGLVVGALVVLGGFLFMADQKNTETLKMESLYFEMTQLANDSKGPSGEQLISKLQALHGQFKASDQKARAGLLLADIQYRNKRYDDALASFKAVKEQTKPGTMSYHLALSGMAHTHESKKDFKQAIPLFKAIIDQPGEHPLFYTYLELARCYELTQDPKNAILILREMQNKFPTHAGLKKVNITLKRLEDAA